MQRKKGVHYCDSQTDAFKMQDQVPISTMFLCVNTSIPINFIMITFPEKNIYGYPHLCGQEVNVKHIHLQSKNISPQLRCYITFFEFVMTFIKNTK